MLASLIRVAGDFTLAEDALQDACHAAVVQWTAGNVPDNPVGWLMATARHKIIDHLRRQKLAAQKLESVMRMTSAEEPAPDPTDLLRLMFTCCHPALAVEAQVALTLRTLGGLRTEEIARAFLVPASTMAQRLVRAKTKIRLAGIPYVVPQDEALPARVSGVLAVLYLIFNEGYSASEGTELLRCGLCEEAIRLCRELVALLPMQNEPQALLALMLLHHSRRATRTDARGDLMLLEDQDRTRWDVAAIKEGAGLVEAVLRRGSSGVYALQAAIAALHAQASSFEKTDWRQIAGLYELLYSQQPSPVVRLNHAVAISMAEGWDKGLAIMDGISLPGYAPLHAARADLLRRLGRYPEAAAAYLRAIALTTHEAERRFLTKRLAEVSHP